MPQPSALARAIEAAATAPLLKHIAELEDMNAQLCEQNDVMADAYAQLETKQNVTQPWKIGTTKEAIWPYITSQHVKDCTSCHHGNKPLTTEPCKQCYEFNKYEPL